MPTVRQRRATSTSFPSGFVQETICIAKAGILTPIVGVIWGLIAKMTLIKIRPSDGYSWFECCQNRDISEIFLESYYISNMLMAFTVGVVMLCNYLVFQINEKAGHYLYSRRVALMLQIPANIAPVFLMGLVVFDEHSWYAGHILCATVAFASFVVYFITTAVFFGITLLRKPKRRTACNMFSLIYFVFITLVCVSCLKLWRAGREIEHGMRADGSSFRQKIVLDPTSSQYEWAAVSCIYFWYVGFCCVFYGMRKGKLC